MNKLEIAKRKKLELAQAVVLLEAKIIIYREQFILRYPKHKSGIIEIFKQSRDFFNNKHQGLLSAYGDSNKNNQEELDQLINDFTISIVFILEAIEHFEQKFKNLMG